MRVVCEKRMKTVLEIIMTFNNNDNERRGNEIVGVERDIYACNSGFRKRIYR